MQARGPRTDLPEVHLRCVRSDLRPASRLLTANGCGAGCPSRTNHPTVTGGRGSPCDRDALGQTCGSPAMTFDAADVRTRIQLGGGRALGVQGSCRFAATGSPVRVPTRSPTNWPRSPTGAAGFLLLGVTDAGQVQEVTRAQLGRARNRGGGSVAANKINPPVEVDVRRLLIEPGKPILSVEVEPGYALHDSPGGRVPQDRQQQAATVQRRAPPARPEPQPGAFPVVRQAAGSGHGGFGTLDEALWKPMLDAGGRLEPRACPREARPPYPRIRRRR